MASNGGAIPAFFRLLHHRRAAATPTRPATTMPRREVVTALARRSASFGTFGWSWDLLQQLTSAATDDGTLGMPLVDVALIGENGPIHGTSLALVQQRALADGNKPKSIRLRISSPDKLTIIEIDGRRMRGRRMRIDVECLSTIVREAIGARGAIVERHVAWSRGVTRSGARRTIAWVRLLLSNQWVRGIGIGVVVGVVARLTD